MRNTHGYTLLNVINTAWPNPSSLTVDATGLTLNGQVVNYVQADLRGLDVELGGGGNTVAVEDTPSSGYAGGLTTYLRTGAGADTVNVRGTTGPLTVDGGGGLDNVYIGRSLSVQDIRGSVTVLNPPVGGYTALVVRDSGDAAPRTVTLGANRLTGLAPAPILYSPSDLRLLIVYTGSGDDTVTVADTPFSGYSGGMQTFLSTGDGNDTITVQQTTGPLTVESLAGDDVIHVGNAAGVLDDIQGELTVIGGDGFDMLTLHDEGSSAGQTYTVTANTVSRPGIARITYDGVGDVVALNAGPGDDRVNVTAVPVNQTIVNGSGGLNSLVGPDSADDWQVVGTNQGYFADYAGGDLLIFTDFANLAGGAADDTFHFWDGAGVTGRIDGGGGTNALDYTAYTSSNVVVSLPASSATGVDGGIANIQNVKGADGGGAAGLYNILVGNGGNVLTGGNGRRNLLVAGESAGTLLGGDDEDILIGGTTAYDTAALQAVMDYWCGSADDYATRVANLLNGEGVLALDAGHVTNNGGGNTLLGHGGGPVGLKLFYGLDPTLETTDYNPDKGEQFINV